MMVRLFTAAKLSKSTELSRLHGERCIPIFVYKYGCSDDLNKMTNLHCCHCLGGGGQVVLSSWFSIKLLQFNLQVFNKNTN